MNLLLQNLNKCKPLDTLNENNLLLAWEKGLNLPPIYRSIHLLELLYPETSFPDLLNFSIGERDAGLLYLRSIFFGNQLENAAFCPNCQEQVEWKMPLENLRIQPLKTEKAIRFFEILYNNQFIKFRLPNSLDIIKLSKEKDVSVASDLLLNNCILNAAEKKLPGEVKTKILSKMEQEDPQADINIDISCPACKHDWTLNFDIFQYLWSEVDDWAYRLFQDIGLLAKNFGWSESDILSMSRFRRNLYISMLKG